MIIPRYLAQLGITEKHLSDCALPLEEEACTLVSAGVDVFDREVLMTPETLEAWTSMSIAAKNDGATLQIVSAFRSVEYQCELIARKLNRGIAIDDILCVNAIPGYSQHHTGRALDLTTPEFPPLETQFEESAAFQWLSEHGSEFGFSLSYPKNNTAGIDYEPWHWAYSQH